MNTNASDARLNALAQIERTERQYRWAFFGAVAVEAALLAGLLFLVNLQDRVQLLLLVGFVGSYSLVVLALVAVGVHVTRVGQRIVRAVDASGDRR